MNFSNIWQHPKTTVVGVLTCIVGVAAVLSQQGVTLGHAGSGTVVGLIASVAVALLGMFSKDPGQGKQPADSSSTQKLGAFALIAILLAGSCGMTGCTGAQVNTVITDINAYLPTALALLQDALTIYAAVGVTPGQTDPVAQGLATAEADMKALQGPIADYLAASSSATKASTWTNIKAVVDTLTKDADQLMQIAALKNAQSQKQALIALTAFDAAVHVIDGYVSSTLTPAQVQARASARTMKFMTLNRMWSAKDKQMIAKAYGEPYPVLMRQAQTFGF